MNEKGGFRKEKRRNECGNKAIKRMEGRAARKG